MNIEEMGDIVKQLITDIAKSQTSLMRCQKLNNEKILRWMKWSKNLKSKVVEQTAQLKNAAKSKEQQNENSILMKRELEKHIRSVTEDLQHQNDILDDRLRTLELQQKHVEVLENVCETTKKSLTDYASKNDGYKRRLKSDIEAYEQNFGVKIRMLDEIKNSNAFQISFTQISAADPEQEFVLIMSQDKKCITRIVECRPLLDDIDADVKKLNHDDGDGLSKFIVDVRSKFQNLNL